LRFVLRLVPPAVYVVGGLFALNAFGVFAFFAFTHVEVGISLVFLGLAIAAPVTAVVGHLRRSQLRFALYYAAAWILVVGVSEIVDHLTIGHAFR
jgi:hypothetical protein